MGGLETTNYTWVCRSHHLVSKNLVGSSGRAAGASPRPSFQQQLPPRTQLFHLLNGDRGQGGQPSALGGRSCQLPNCPGFVCAPPRASQRQTGQPTFLSSGRPLSLSRLPSLHRASGWSPPCLPKGVLSSLGGTQHGRVGIHEWMCPINSNDSINASLYNLISSRGYLGGVGKVMNGQMTGRAPNSQSLA